MPLSPGSRFGVYEVIAQIGEGGMGQVYRATDTTLGRQVAIKVLPEAFASDAERVAPNNPLIRLGRGQAELAAARYRTAEESLRAALTADPWS